MLQPKRVKYRKTHKGHRRGKAHTGNTIVFGDFGLQALESFWITARQIEAARRAITHHIRRGGKIWIRIFPDKPVTKKPAETRMGSGKGPPDHWVAVVKPGRILFEMGGVGEELAREAMCLASHKLPIDTKFVVREISVVPDKDSTNKELAQVEVEDIRALSPKELAKQLEAAHQELFNLRFRLATKQLVNHREIPRVKRKISRLKTIIRERELGIR